MKTSSVLIVGEMLFYIVSNKIHTTKQKNNHKESRERDKKMN